MAELGALSRDDWAFWDTWMRAQRLLTREFDRSLVRGLGVSKAEFAVLATLDAAPAEWMRVSELAAALEQDKGGIAHQLTRMEARGLLRRDEAGAPGRRTGVGLTAAGREMAGAAIRLHAANIRGLVLESMPADERAAIETWSSRLLQGFESTRSEPTARGIEGAAPAARANRIP